MKAMNELLWTLAVVGAWNAINMAGRIYYKAPWWPYWWHVFTGAWAAWLLWQQ
jgi:hypothetical protein